MTLATAPSLLRLSPTASSQEQALLREMVSRLRARDDALLNRVLKELFPEVRRWMYKQLGSHRDIEDAVQDALSEIAGALHRFEGRSSLATLARRITVRTSYRYYRGNDKHQAVQLREVEPVGGNVEAQVAARKALARLHDALQSLPDRRRSAFVLCAIEGLTPTEAASVLGVSPNAMRSLLCRARQQMEEILADDDELGRSSLSGARS